MLTSSLYSAISGLTSTGDSMQIIGDNIANTNTTGFKSSSYSFQDLLSQSIATQSGTAQIGRGTALNDITTNWNQGSFKTTENTTDLAISGDGFFIVRDNSSESVYYTRAGEFSFDDDGNLVNSEKYVVQGWELTEDGEAIGAVTDITLDSFTSPPQETDKVTLIANLNSDATSQSAVLLNSWDGTASPPIATTSYEYQTAVSVYDSLGNTHDLTVYYDKGNTAGTWEYIVTCNPDEDLRAGFDTTIYQGLFASGEISFSDDSGEILGMTLNTLDDTTPTWTSTSPSTEGYLEFNCDFIGGTATDQTMALNIGTRWDGSAWINDGESTTQYAAESSTTYRTADGYGKGDLQTINVDTSGVITGTYSNGAVISLYQVALGDFTNVDGLTKLGGGLFQESNSSGVATTNFPGISGLGNISPNSLEQSNVDIATEFVKMIEIQRSYQANSKMITTVDDMLSNTISMKR